MEGGHLTWEAWNIVVKEFPRLGFKEGIKEIFVDSAARSQRLRTITQWDSMGTVMSRGLPWLAIKPSIYWKGKRLIEGAFDLTSAPLSSSQTICFMCGGDVHVQRLLSAGHNQLTRSTFLSDS